MTIRVLHFPVEISGTRLRNFPPNSMVTGGRVKIWILVCPASESEPLNTHLSSAALESFCRKQGYRTSLNSSFTEKKDPPHNGPCRTKLPLWGKAATLIRDSSPVQGPSEAAIAHEYSWEERSDMKSQLMLWGHFLRQRNILYQQQNRETPNPQ